MSEPRFGVRLPVAGVLASPAAIRRVATTAEDLGFDTLWVHDYIIWTKELDRLHISCGSREAVDAAGEDYPPIFYESLSSLAYVAGITERIRLGTAVLCLPYRDPVVTAKQIATIDTLSAGRIELGIGQGAPKSTLNEEFEILGIPRAEKVSRTREALDVMQLLWHEDRPSFEGRFTTFGPATIYPKPVQQPSPPIWIGGSAEKSLEMIADYADGWLSFWINPDQFPKAIADLHARLERRGRAPESLQIGTEIQICLADSTAEARRSCERTMGVFEEGYAGTTGAFSDTDASTMDEIWASSLVGSSSDVVSRIGEFLDSGCTVFELKFIYHTIDDLIEQLQRFSAEVAPHVGRSAVPA
jgi:probable F420-dependent oxidoreductase